jgi:DNA-binding LacI/PurR family transcriptional regulator
MDRKGTTRQGAGRSAAGVVVTMADLGRLAGVSKITVSRALSGNGVVSERTRKKVLALAARHGYRINVSARNLRLRQSHTVAVVARMSPSPARPESGAYPLELLGGITHELAKADYSVLLTPRQDTSVTAVGAADAMILLGQGARQQAVHAFDQLDRPMVVWGAPRADDEHVVVGSDNRLGGRTAAERFVALGRRRPVFFGHSDHPEMADRLDGFVEYLNLHGIEPIVVDRTPLTMQSGTSAVQSLIGAGARFDAIFTCNDLLAMGAIRALIENGLRVPDDVSVIGYDDTPVAAAFIPPLSSVHQNWHEGGILLARKVLEMLRGEAVESETLPSRLVLRAT